jgi:hypothetical protein
MTELREPSAGQTADALPLGPQSLVWRYFGDNRMFLIGPRPAVLQNMLAELGQGVLDHSVFFSDTSARIKRSLPPIFKTVYGSDNDNTGQQVRDFHHQIKGEMPSGDRYHALDPDTYFWAHATFVEQVLYFADTFVKRLTDADLVPPLRRQRSADARDLPGVREVLGSHDRARDDRAPHREIRCGVCDQRIPLPEGPVAVGMAGGGSGVQPTCGVSHHRRDAAADPDPARSALE